MILEIKTFRKYKLVDKIPSFFKEDPSDSDESSVNGGCWLCREGITMTAADCTPSLLPTQSGVDSRDVHGSTSGCLGHSEHEQTKVFNRFAEQPRHTDLQSQGMVTAE
jgi:hypothetical protein